MDNKNMLVKNKVGILKKGKFILFLLIIIEFAYFILCLMNTPPLLRALLVLPSLFVIPGTILLSVLRRTVADITKLMVEGFFVSTLISVLLTSIMLFLGFPLNPLNYSLATLVITSSLFIIALIRKVEFKFSKSDILLVIMTFLSSVLFLLYFSKLPRLFTPDETNYIFSSRMGILNGVVPPMGVRPDRNEICALFQGRYFWIYLLASFMGSTGLPAYQVGLLNISFLVLTALASSLFVGNKWLRITVFILVIINPLLFSFSALTLNDLAISFYAVFAVLFFINSFSRNNDNLEIRIGNLFCSLIGIIILAMIKLNLLVFVVIWIILVCFMLWHRLYKRNWKYKILILIIVLPILLYELCIDIPYVISVWVLRSRELGALFSKFLFISPVEMLIGLFLAPWWNPGAQTLFTCSSADYLDYFYRTLMPESSSILVSAIVLALPILSQIIRKDLDKIILILLVLVSLTLFYFEVLGLAGLIDIARFSMWMVPLWIPLAVMVLKDIKNNLSLRLLLPILIAALILLLINLWLSKEKGGVYIGYGLPSRLWTADLIVVQFILLMVTLSLPLIAGNLIRIRLIVSKLSLERTINMKNTMFCLIIILITLNGTYFSLLFIENSRYYKDNGFIKISNILNEVESTGGLIFANNYIYMRSYVSDGLFKSGLLLPPPDSKEEFLKLLEMAPNRTLFLISDDDTTTWYEYANKYIKTYIDFEAITPEKSNISKLPRFDLTEPVLKMCFEDANETTIADYSGFKNNGVNHGTDIAEGYYGRALRFDGKGYVSITNSDSLNAQNSITIGFLAKIERAERGKGYMILSKGYSIINGSYDIFVYNGEIYFELGKVGYLSIPAEPYVGTWHHFIFTYDGEKMEIYIDGSLTASKSASGLIRISDFDLEIGRDAERKSYYFIGLIDELQISKRPINKRELMESYYTAYALRVCELPLNARRALLFSSFSNKNVNRSVIVRDPIVRIHENFTVTLEIQMEAQKPQNVSILIATDRFTKVYVSSLSLGLNNVYFRFDYVVDPSWYEAGGFYWLHLAQTRVIVIEDGAIIYNNLITTQDLRMMNALLLMLSLGIFISFSILQYMNFGRDQK